MFHRARQTGRSRPWLMALVVASGAVLLGGCPSGTEGPPGPAGPAGPAGPPGADGRNAGDPLPETVVEITSVNGGEAVATGKPFSVSFRLTDGSNNTVLFEELDRFSTYVSGPTNGYQRVIVPEGDPNNVTMNEDGTYTYTFPGGFPTTYAPPYNVTTGGGGAVTPGTYSIGIEARRTFTSEGVSIRKAGDAFQNFVVGGVETPARELVNNATCNTCHISMTVHGENRFKIEGCVLCHTAGSEDRPSNDPSKATPGVSIEFSDLIHRLHKGVELERVAATANSTDPYRYEVIGFNETLHDYSDVHFPFMPGGTGFNQQTRNCQTCHGTAQMAQIYDNAKVTRKNCTQCHDSLDFTLGTTLDPNNPSVAGGLLTQNQLSDPAFRVAPGGTPHRFSSDDTCTFCHGAGQSWAVESVHTPVLRNPTYINGLKVVIDSVGGNVNPGYFVAGERPVVTFRLLDGNDNPVAMENIASLNLVFAGPVENYQKVLPTSGSTAAIKSVATDGTVTMTGGVSATGTGPFVYTSPTAIPATYPAPANNSDSYTYEDGWGELSGQALVPGSYTFMVYAYRNIVVEGVTYREATLPATFHVRIGTAGPTYGYLGLVTDAKCNSCHGDLRLHGNGRRGVENCVVCHVAGAEDRPTPAQGQTQDPAPDSIDWKVMIHKIHHARELSLVKNGGKLDYVVFRDNVADFSTAYTPVMPDGNSNCTVCHATDAWKAPLERADVNIWLVACTSCHDAQSTYAHAKLNTLPGTNGNPGTESCATCHGDGALFSVESSHARK